LEVLDGNNLDHSISALFQHRTVLLELREKTIPAVQMLTLYFPSGIDICPLDRTRIETDKPRRGAIVDFIAKR
jgi:hypothetical protein